MRPAAALAASVLALASLGSLAACDDDKKAEELIAKTAVDAAKPAPAASAASPVDAAPPPKKVVTCAPGSDVDFHGNAALEAEVRRKLGKDSGTVAQADLKTIKSINLSQAQVDDLDPCVWPLFTGVHDVFLGRGDLDDLTPLAGLTQLVTLRAALNRVSDLTPLTKMTKMDRLDVSHTAVHDISALANMTALTEIQLDDTQVMDLSPLAPLKALERVSIRNTPVVDLSPLKDHKKLRFVYIEGTPISDISPLQPLMASGLKIMNKGRM
jgi:internalin A